MTCCPQPHGQGLRCGAIGRRSDAHAIERVAAAGALGDVCPVAMFPEFLGEPLGIVAAREASDLHRPCTRIRMRVLRARVRRLRARVRRLRRCLRILVSAGRLRLADRRRRSLGHKSRRCRRRLSRRNPCGRGGRGPRCRKWLGRRCWRCWRCRGRTLALLQVEPVGSQSRPLAGGRSRPRSTVRTGEQLWHQQHEAGHQDHCAGQSLFDSQFHVGARDSLFKRKSV